MWQAFRNEVHSKGVEVVTVGMDTLGAQSCVPFIEAAKPEHPSLIDVNHVMAERFGVVNIPNGIWINEHGVIVRPAEPAFPPGLKAPRGGVPDSIPQRMKDIFGEATKISVDRNAYSYALYDWIEKGDNSEYVLSPEEVVQRSASRDVSSATAAAHFVLAQYCWNNGHRENAISHFREAHRLQPDNISYKRQAWSLMAPADAGPFTRFWQGPEEGKENEWPFESDWLSEIRAMGAENYYPEFRP